MKQYTNESQTAKLIELGFDMPCSIASVEPIYGMGGISVAKAYTIGELISFLPDDGVSDKRLEFDGFHWLVDWDSFDKIHQTMQVELIDALYDMVIKLKEEGVI